jgi:hypothetical protein
MADYNTIGRPRLHPSQLPQGERSLINKSIRPPLDFSDEVRIVYDELMSLLLSKHNDYGPKNIADAPGGALNGLRVRMHDKLARINNLVDSGSSPEHESIEDSFKDMANYAIIGLLVLREKWNK